jgi:DNA invertase Pin-like site-specific DNA recombinase
VVETYRDAGISGAKGRDKRPGFDAMLKDAGRRKFDVVMAWAIDRLGRSLIDLLGTIEHLEAVGVDLYLDQQSIDTTTPAGKLLFQLTGAFAEFERSMIRQRVRAGLIKVKLARDGKFISKKGNVRTKLGRPGAEPNKMELARRKLAKGIGIGKVAREVGLGVGTVHRLKRRSKRMPPVDAKPRQTARPDPQDGHNQHLGYPSHPRENGENSGLTAPHCVGL